MIRLFLVFFTVIFCNAQQIEPLKVLKNKYDSLNIALKQDYQKNIIGKSEKEINEIYFSYISSVRNNNIKRYADYEVAVKEFFNHQKLAEPSTEINNTDLEEKPATYSLGFEKLYKEVHEFIQNRYQDDFEYYSNSAKIHFIVQNDNSLYIEKVEGTNSDFNNLALMAFLMTKGEWKSGFQRGKNVKTKFTLPVKFVVEE